MRGLLRFLLFITILSGVYYAREFMIRREIAGLSQSHVEQAVGAITLRWEKAVLDQQAEPSLAQRVSVTGNPHALDFAYYSRLGGRISEVGCSLDDYTRYKSDIKNYISANYTCAVQYEKGVASVLVTILRDTDYSPWRIAYFDVISPYLDNPNPQEPR